MPPRHATRTVATLGVVLLATAIVGAALALGDPSPRSADPASGSTAPSTVTPESPTAAADPTGTLGAARDERVAFWEARLEDGGGYESGLRLVDALLERARATGDLADVARASAALDEVEPAAPPQDPGLPERRGRIAFTLHDFEEAVRAADAVLAIDPTSRTALALLGDASLELGREADADAAYAALADRGRGPAVLSRLARRAWLDGDDAHAEALVRDAIEGALLGTADERAFYQFQLGEMLRWRNELAGSEAAYRAALDLQPDHVPSMGGLALVLEARRERDAAIELLETATGRLPAPDLVAALGDLYALDGRPDDAEDRWALVERIAEVAASTGGVYDRQLVLFLADHDRDPSRAVALAEAEIAVRQDVYGWDALAWALHAAGRHEQADAAMAEALRLGTPDGRFRYHAGMIALALGRLDEARAHLVAARAADASLPPLQVPRLDAALAEVGP